MGPDGDSVDWSRRLISRGSALGLLTLLALTGQLRSQEAGEQEHAGDDHHFHRNHVAVFLGATTALDRESGGKTSFTIGADYERRITPTLGVMALADFAFGDHKRTALFAAMFAGRPIDALRLAVGPGFELVEKDKTAEDGSSSTEHSAFFVISTRATYDFHVGRLSLSPAAGLDFIGETKTSFVYGVAVGIGF